MRTIARTSIDKTIVRWAEVREEQAAVVATLESSEAVVFPLTTYSLRLMRVLRLRLWRRGVRLTVQTSLRHNTLQVTARVGNRPAYLLSRKAGRLYK